MKSKAKAPVAADPVKITAAQLAANDANAANNRQLNNSNLNMGPAGSVNFVKNADGTTTQNVNYSDNTIGAMNAQQATGRKLAEATDAMASNINTGAFGLPNDLPGRVTELDKSGLKNLNSQDYAGARDAYTEDVYARGMRMLQPQQDMERRQHEQYLSDRGLPWSGEAYEGDIGRMEQNQGLARQNLMSEAMTQGAQEQSRLFGLDNVTNQNIIAAQTTDAQLRDQARTAGIAEAKGIYDAPVQRIAMLNQAAPQTPVVAPQGFNTFASGGSDIAGNTQNAFNNQMEIKKAADAQSAAMMNAIVGIAGTAGKVAMSDENMKEDIGPADSETPILDAVENIPISSWRYKAEAGQDDGQKHVGPMAQDFKGFFGLGDGKSIPFVDGMGVNMRATQQLARKVRALEARVK